MYYVDVRLVSVGFPSLVGVVFHALDFDQIGGSSKQCSGGGDSTAHSMESTISAV